jgi:hypothetical protein
VTARRSPGRTRPGPAPTFVTKTDDEPTSFTLVGNVADSRRQAVFRHVPYLRPPERRHRRQLDAERHRENVREGENHDQEARGIRAPRRARSARRGAGLPLQERVPHARGRAARARRTGLSARRAGVSLLLSHRLDGGDVPGYARCRRGGQQERLDPRGRAAARAVHRQLRYPLHGRRLQPEGDRASGGRAASGAVPRHHQRSSLRLGARYRPSRRRCGQGRQAPHPAARLQGGGSGRVLLRAFEDLLRAGGRPRAAARRRHERRSRSTAQGEDLSALASGQSARLRVRGPYAREDRRHPAALGRQPAVLGEAAHPTSA